MRISDWSSDVCSSDLDVLKKQLHLLDDSNEIVRYWAAVGLRSQQAGKLRPYAGRIAKLLSDTYPPVAITAAAVLYELNQDDRSKECLIRYMLDENDYWALMSVNYALYSDHKEAFIESDRKSTRLNSSQ